MKQYSAAAVERAMKVQEVIVGAMSKRLSWSPIFRIIFFSQSETLTPMQNLWYRAR